MFCAITGETPEEPIISKKTGQVYEKRVLKKYLDTHDNREPGSSEPSSEEDLITVKVSPNIRPRPTSATSLPALLSLFQNEWDSLMLETFNLKKELDSVKKELSHSLYQHDAALRVIARLTKERDEARNALSNLSSSSSTKKQVPEKSDQMDVEKKDSTLPSEVEKKIDSVSQELSSQRKKRPISDQLATVEEIKEYSEISSNSTHKTSSPGITTLDIHSDQNLIVSGSLDGKIVVWSREDKKAESTIDGHSGKVTNVLFHPTLEDTFLSTSVDKTAKVWKRGKSAEAVFTFQGHKSEVIGASIHPAGDFFLTASQEGDWAFHDFHGKTLSHCKASDDKTQLRCVSFHPDGMILGGGVSDGSIKIWDLKSQTVAATFPSPKDTSGILSLSFSENGFLVAAGSENSIALWDLRKGKSSQLIELDKFGLQRVQYDYSGSYLLATGADLRVFGGKTLEAITSFTKHSDVVTDAKWGKNAKFIASCSKDRTVKVWSKKESNKKRKT